MIPVEFPFFTLCTQHQNCFYYFMHASAYMIFFTIKITLKIRCMDNSPSFSAFVCIASTRYREGGDDGSRIPCGWTSCSPPADRRSHGHIHPVLPSPDLLRLEMLVVSLIPCSQQQNHRNFPSFSKCQQCILYPEKAIWFLHSLKVKEKRFYIRKRCKPEKRTRKRGGSCRESGYSAAAAHRQAFAARPQITRTTPATPKSVADMWEVCECRIRTHSYKLDHLF